MSKPLPKTDFKRKRVIPTEKEILKKTETAKNGWILGVDLEYQEELHEQLSPAGTEEKGRGKGMDVAIPKEFDKRPGLSPP